MKVKEMLIAGVIFVLLVTLVPFKGCANRFYSWKAEEYGADWLVIQYSATGTPINIWELQNKAIKSESRSDGIFFLDNDNNVVHLSGHYMYIQVQSWEKVTMQYLEKNK